MMMSSYALTDHTKFDPQPGDVKSNISKANAILDQADPQHLDLLVLPELTFSGEFGTDSYWSINPNVVAVRLCIAFD